MAPVIPQTTNTVATAQIWRKPDSRVPKSDDNPKNECDIASNEQWS